MRALGRFARGKVVTMSDSNIQKELRRSRPSTWCSACAAATELPTTSRAAVPFAVPGDTSHAVSATLPSRV